MTGRRRMRARVRRRGVTGVGHPAPMGHASGARPGTVRLVGWERGSMLDEATGTPPSATAAQDPAQGSAAQAGGAAALADAAGGATETAATRRRGGGFLAPLRLASFRRLIGGQT